MTFKLSDAGRSKSKRPKQQRDCTVRALALVLTVPYDRAYDILSKAGRECGHGFDIEGWGRRTHLYDGANDHIFWRIQKMPYTKDPQRSEDTTHHEVGQASRYRLRDFIKDRPKGRFIVSTARHVFAVIDGVVYDDAPWHYAENRPVYAWMEAIVVRQPLWQAYAARRPISKKLSRMVKRRVAIVEGGSYNRALQLAGIEYEYALKKHEDLTVEPL